MQYEEAVRLLHYDFHPTLKPIAQVLELHAYAELREVKKAKSAFDMLAQHCPPVLLSIRDELGARCGFLQPKSNRKPNQWLFEQESNSLLLAA